MSCIGIGIGITFFESLEEVDGLYPWPAYIAFSGKSANVPVNPSVGSITFTGKLPYIHPIPTSGSITFTGLSASMTGEVFVEAGLGELTFSGVSAEMPLRVGSTASFVFAGKASSVSLIGAPTSFSFTGYVPTLSQESGGYSLSNVTSGYSATSGTTHNFSSVAIGAADANRMVYVGVCGRGIGSSTISSVTIGGVSATQQCFYQADEGGSHFVYDQIAIYSANVPTGTTATISVVFSASRLRCGYISGTCVGTSATAYDTLTDEDQTTSGCTLTGTIDFPSGGILIAIANTAESSSSFTWTNATEFNDTTYGSSHFSGAYGNTLTGGTGETVEATVANPSLNSTMAVATFGAA